MQNKIVEGDFLLQKFPGKGGWTFASIPEINPDKKGFFNYVKVSGTIDDFEISDTHLMPMGDGTLFIAVKTEIRKSIRKQEGDMVHIVLYSSMVAAPAKDNLLLCLEDEPEAKSNFELFSSKEKEAYFDFISAAKGADAEVERIIKSIDRIKRNLRFTDKPNK